MRGSHLLLPTIFVALFALIIGQPSQAGPTPFKLVKQKERSARKLIKAAYGKGGTLGSFVDIDLDRDLEFVSLTREKSQLWLSVLELADDRETFRVPVGEGAAAGLVAVNLDDDAELEFVLGYGSRKQAIAATIVSGAVAGWWTSAAHFTTLLPGATTDLWHLAAYDDDGSEIWSRELDRSDEASEPWKNARFKFVIPNAAGDDATILVTDDSQEALRGVSARTGKTIWSRNVGPGPKPSRRDFSPLVHDSQLLPVLYSPERTLILDPSTGEPLLDSQLEARISRMPTQRVFATGNGPGFIVYGEDRKEIRMLSLTTGKTIWTHQMEAVREIVPGREDDEFIAVWRHGIKFLHASGEILSEHAAPAKIKATVPPIFRDLDGDGTAELVYVSGKSIACWEPESESLRWIVGLGSMLGAASPLGLHDSFYDLDQDGWLDVPGHRSSGAGVWISGKSGELLAEGKLGKAQPIVGDWNDDGTPEIFWSNGWYEAVPK